MARKNKSVYSIFTVTCLYPVGRGKYMDSDYIKWMPFITGVLSALIAAVVACFIAMLNNHTARVKSQNE